MLTSWNAPRHHEVCMKGLLELMRTQLHHSQTICIAIQSRLSFLPEKSAISGLDLSRVKLQLYVACKPHKQALIKTT